jgi:hypothetical protein
MPESGQNAWVGEAPLTDASVWRAIRYLDSPTGYREHLPDHSRRAAIGQAEFVVLDDAPSKKPNFLMLLCIALLIAAILLIWMGS